ncbi:MAG: siderophore-interacting protein [Acidimicrobiaceae bacterium]|nr:siderophore-interacting protein [Acidimicrobiaceae bacterium]
MNTSPHQSSIELAARLGVDCGVGDVISTSSLGPSLHEVVLGHASRFAGAPGNDIMVRLASSPGHFTRRRYSVRAVDTDRDALTLWITTSHDGSGSRWATNARVGDEVDVVGPRGKITLDHDADWHLFIGDTSGFAAFYRMAQAIETPGRAIFIVEVDALDDVVTSAFDDALGVTGIFIDRQGRGPSDPSGVLSALAAFEFPPDVGHAYLFGEFSVTKAAQVALVDRGLDQDRISRKAYWRAGRNNADGGEPDKSDD